MMASSVIQLQPRSFVAIVLLSGFLLQLMSPFRMVDARPRDVVLKELTDALGDPMTAYMQWKTKFNKTFTAEGEDSMRLEIFKKAVKFCLDYNSNNTMAWVGLGPFSHLTNAEYKASYSGLTLPSKSRRGLHQSSGGTCTSKQYNKVSPIPKVVDWTAASPPVLSPIQDQGSCNDCWTFSSAGAMESLIAIVSNSSVVPLSPQTLTSCVTSASGCSEPGGNQPLGFEFAISNKGLPSAETYPFVGYTSTNAPTNTPLCNKALATEVEPGSQITGYCILPANSASALQAAATYQPVSVSVDSSSSVFQYYQGGILTGKSCGTSIDHAILVVGYNMTASTPYWLVKNQWGTSWGEEGYVQISASSTGSPAQGVCGILSYNSIPIMNNQGGTTSPVSSSNPSSPSKNKNNKNLGGTQKKKSKHPKSTRGKSS